MADKRVNTAVAVALVFSMSAGWAQDPAVVPATSAGMDKVDRAGNERLKKTGEVESMPGMDHSQMNHGDGGMDHGSMSMQGGSAPPDARDPHAYSGGYDFGPLKLRMADELSIGSLLVDNL